LNTDATLEELIDRDAIRDCIYRYCRGVDRADMEALRSVYWPRATDRHGPFQGTSEGFIEWVLASLPNIERSIHQVHNILIEFRDGGAAVETYYTGMHRARGPDGELRQARRAGRYVDWFEKRGGEWRIAARTVVYDWSEDLSVSPGTESERFGPRKPIGSPFPDDPIYTLLRENRRYPTRDEDT
jgi:hypothetical protein